MRRVFLIAKREYFAYARTVGFWLSMLVLPGFILLGSSLPGYMKNAAPTRQVAIVDLSGQDAGAALTAAMAKNRLKDDADDMRDAAIGEAGREKADALRTLVEREGVEAGLARLRQIAPKVGSVWKPAKQSVVIVQSPMDVAAARTVPEAEAALRPYIDGDRMLAGKTAMDAAVILTVKDGQLA
jgi:ABC-2 type transport system permease protein